MEKISRLRKSRGVFTPKSVTGIQPFVEKAAPEKFLPDQKIPGIMSGVELFSLFTADVITSKQTFIR